LRLRISDTIRAPWDSFNLVIGGNIVKFSENGKTIRDLRVKRNE